MNELLKTLEALGFRGMIGLLRARSQGVISAAEYHNAKEYAHNTLVIPRDWFRTLVWSVS